MPIENPSVLSQILAGELATDFPLVMPGGRLTTTQNNPLGDSAGSPSVFYVPYIHPFIPVYNNSTQLWNYLRVPDAGVQVGLVTGPNGTMDIFAGGSQTSHLFFSRQGWSSGSGRLYPVVNKGIKVIDFGSSITERYRTYLGTIRSSGTESNVIYQDSVLRRHIWNAYNRIHKPLVAVESAASWSINNTAARTLANARNTLIEFVSGEDSLSFEVRGRFSAYVPPGSFVVYSMLINNTYGGYEQVVLTPGISGESSICNETLNRTALGINTVEATESYAGSSTPTGYGYSRSGLRGMWFC